MRHCFIVAAALLCAAAASAGTKQEYRFLGFSPDGSSFAYEVFGVQDGSGFAFYTLHLRGARTLEIVRQGDDQSMGDVGGFRRDALRQAAGALKAAGIDARFDGRVTLADTRTNETNASLTFTPSGAPGTPCRVHLVNTEHGPAHADWEMRSRVARIELEFRDRTAIVHDEPVPKRSAGAEPGFCFGYGLLEVRERGGTVVIVVSRSTPGFEGPDSAVMVFSTQLARK